MQWPESLTEEEVREVTNAFSVYYNTERPNQARSCGNRPLRVAFPELPTLPPLPEAVDPGAWLAHIHGHAFARRVQPNGSVEVDRRPYYIKQQLVGQQVALVVNAPERRFEVLVGQELVKSVAIKGLVSQPCCLTSTSLGCGRKCALSTDAGSSSTGVGGRRACGPIETLTARR